MDLVARNRWRRLPRAVRLAALVLLAALTAVSVTATAANVAIHRAADERSYDDVPAVPTRTVAMVFGTLVEPDGTPSDRLADRVRAAVELYHAGRVRQLLMTGDRHAGYDEVGAMRRQAEAAGVPAGAITEDGSGLDSYDSCVRARTLQGVRDAVLVTQAYHLPRALYLCRHHGIDAVGLAVPDWQHHPERARADYPWHKWLRYTVREWIARAWAAVDAHVLDRPPAVRA